MTSTWGRSQERNSFGTFKEKLVACYCVIATHLLENDLWHGPVEAVSIISSTCLLPPNLLEVWCHSAGPLYFILLPPGLWCPIDCPRSTSATAVLSLGFCTLALGRDGGNVGYLGVGPVPWGLPHGFRVVVPTILLRQKKNIAPGSWWFLPCGSRSLNTGCAGTPSEKLPNLKRYGLVLFLLLKIGSIMFNEVCPHCILELEPIGF